MTSTPADTTASATAPASQRSPRPWAAILLIAGLLAAQVVQAVRLFPTPRALLDDDHPVLAVDHAIHLYHGALGSRFLWEHGTTWGYDPFFMAGYPETPVWDSSSNPSILFQALAGGGYHPRAYNLGLVACSVLAVASIPAGAAAAGVGITEAALAALLGWLYFHCGWPDMFWRSGLFAFVTASAGFVLLTGLLLRFERRQGPGAWAALAVVGTVLWFMHVTAPILAVGAVLGLAATALRRRSWRWWGSLGLAAALALAVNLVWLVPLWNFRGIREPRGFFMAPGSARAFVDQYLHGGVDGYLGLLILVLGAGGLACWLAERQYVRTSAVGGAALVFLGLALFGGQWDATRVLEPFRFRVPLHLALAVPAATALVRLTAVARRLAGGGRRGVVAAACAWVVVVGGAAAATPQTRAAMIERLAVRRPLVAGLRPEMERLVRWLAEDTDPSARILLEDQLRLYEDTDPESTHWTPLLPVLLGKDRRQFLGGLYQGAFIDHHRYASFGDFHLGGRPIDAWSPAALREYCRRYNVGWVVCWSPLSRFTFDRLGFARRVATLPRYHSPGRPVSRNPREWEPLLARGGPDLAARYLREGETTYAVYRLDLPHSFFLAGEGRVADVAPNRIELTGLVPSGGALVLSLHWLDTWRTDPPLPVDPLPLPDDPVPLVRISTSRPLQRLVLENGYGR